jgi:biopolymer transport protein ExbD
MKPSYPAFPEQQSEVDLTPMLDVVFIMLIFFVVTAAFIKEAGVPVAAPPDAQNVTEAVAAIVVTVEPAGVFKVNGRLLGRESLAPYVRALHADSPQAPYSVLVLKSSKVGDTVAAVEAGRLIGFDVIPISRAE